MGIVHRATLTPSKQELVEAWLPSRPWGIGQVIVRKVGEYRFDDPAGEVGIETILWRTTDGTVLQTPLTYRAEPLAGAQSYLIGHAEHSVLGGRWVYDGCGDPVWAQVLATAILTGGTQAQEYFEEHGQQIEVPARMQVRGSGSPAADWPRIESIDAVRDGGPVADITAGGCELVLARVVGAPIVCDATLTGTWADNEPVALAGIGRR